MSMKNLVTINIFKKSFLSSLNRSISCYSLQTYHSLYNIWALKSTHYSYSEMVERAHLAALGFKSKSQLNQAKIKQDVQDHKCMDFKTC